MKNRISEIIELPYGSKPFEPRSVRLPAIEQAIEIAKMLPENSVARRKLLTDAARMWSMGNSILCIAESATLAP